MNIATISALANHVTSDGGEPAIHAFIVTNTTSRAMPMAFDVIPQGAARRDWFSVERQGDAPLQPNASEEVTVTVELPADMPRQVYTFRLLAFSAEKGRAGEDFTEGPAVGVEFRAAPEPAPAPIEPTTRWPRWIIPTGVGVLAILVAVMTFVLWPGGVAVPDLAGLSMEAASSELAKAGLKMGRTEKQAAQGDRVGLVIGSDPSAGSKAKEGSSVDVIVGAATLTTVPKLVGLTRADANRELDEAGLQMGRVSQKTVARGTTGAVLETKPNAGEKVEEGSRIDVVLSQVKAQPPQAPACTKKTDRLPSASVTLVPKHTRGDRDFGGNGPTSTSTVTLLVKPNAIQARVSMRAFESRSGNKPQRDHTTAEGAQTFPLYTAPPGFQVANVRGVKTTSHTYRDGNHQSDAFDMGSGGPVRRLIYVGDTHGGEAGTKTRVDVQFNRLTIDLVQSGSCRR